MNDFRKQMHIAYKKKLLDIIFNVLDAIGDNGEEFEKNPGLFVQKWLDSNCLPMGDFDKEKAIKEIEEWSK